MASTTFIDNQTTIYAAWLNDVNNAVYNGIFQSSSVTATNMICTGTASGAGFTNLVNNTFASPAAIGNVTPNTGAFTTLTATTPIAVTSGGTGVATKTGTGSNVLNTSPTIATPTITGNITDGTYTTSVSATAQGTAKAWVTFNSSGTVLASYNVSNVTKNSSGNWTLNFTNAIADANYAVVGSALGGLYSLSPISNTTTTCNFAMWYHSQTTNGVPTPTDSTYNSVIIFR